MEDYGKTETSKGVLAIKDSVRLEFLEEKYVYVFGLEDGSLQLLCEDLLNFKDYPVQTMRISEEQAACLLTALTFYLDLKKPNRKRKKPVDVIKSDNLKESWEQ